ncbi:MAG: methyltransferase domain-containing protein, partial [Gammaproteobacteria bacterium]|nr:methyltransferase domain-containing protein [Gammaproteobacteria bacterium]
HGADLELVLEALRRVHREQPGSFELCLVGVAHNPPGDPWIRQIPVPEGMTAYPLFMQWLSSLPSFDFGIAPLEDNLFNRRKSAIKYFDYTHLGLPTVASAVGPYPGAINHGVTGLLVENTPQAWYETLVDLIANRPDASVMVSPARANMADGTAEKSRVRMESIAALTEDQNHASSNAEQVEFNGANLNLTREQIADAFLFGDGIEIGALQNPLSVPRTASVKYVDRMPKDQLYEHYPELKSHTLVDVDIVDDGETLALFADASVDFVIANHFIEHSEDPISTIRNMIRVLKPGGAVFLAVPDKRATFDSDRDPTPLSHVLEDDGNQGAASRRKHYEEWVEIVEPHFGRTYSAGEPFESRVAGLMKQRYSIHFHCWEPSGFRELLDHLRTELQSFEIPLCVTRQDEFIAILTKLPADLSIDDAVR